MKDFGDRLLDKSDRLLTPNGRKSAISHFRPAVVIIVPLLAILFQFYVPRFITALTYLELPLLATVYFALMRRSPVIGSLTGAAIGLTQDSLSHHPVGMYGLVKTLVGYLAASVSQRFNVENPVMRFLLGLFFFLLHQFLYWILARALLDQSTTFPIQQTLISGMLNATVAIPLFLILDKLRETP